MNTGYNTDEWAAETTRGRQVFNHNYRMLGAEIKGWKLIKAVTMQQSQDITERVYLWQSKTDPDRELVRVSITERASWRLAQESLAARLNESSRPEIPRGTRQLAPVGDVNYVARESQTDTPAAVSFVRGNVCVSVSSVGESNVDVAAFAQAVDEALGERPAQGQVDKGKVQQAPRRAAMEAGEERVLIDNLENAAPGGGWLKVIVPDGELSRAGDALVYVTPHGGDKQAEMFVAPND